MEDKKGFVEGLSYLLSKHCSCIEYMEYFKPGKEYSEEVVITYRGGYQQTVNVSWDSIPAILRDIAREIEL
jgi:hypothetical protein